jgi:hypothetical protein
MSRLIYEIAFACWLGFIVLVSNFFSSCYPADTENNLRDNTPETFDQR